jgi:hypothetical protein
MPKPSPPTLTPTASKWGALVWHKATGITSAASNAASSLASETLVRARKTLALKQALEAQLDSLAGFFVGLQGGELHQWAQDLCTNLGFRLPQDAALTDVRSIVPILLRNAPTLVLRATDAQGTLAIFGQHLLLGAGTAKKQTLARARRASPHARIAAATALGVMPDTLNATLDALDATPIAANTAAPLARKLALLYRALEKEKMPCSS